MLYLCLCFLLLWGVYLAPGLAFYPKMVKNPLLAVLIPLFSVGLVTLCVMPLLQITHLWAPWMLQTITVLFSMMAIGRLYQIRKEPHCWKPWQWQLFFFNALLLLPYFVKAGLQGFDTDDEIYSWNFWALQHVFQEVISFEHTGAPYPQLFPKLIAYQYELLNNVELQLPVKALLVLFSFCSLNIIAFAGTLFLKSDRSQTFSYQIQYGVLCLWMVFALNWQQYFDYGYADMPMVAFLMGSVSLWVHSKEPRWVVLAVFLAFCAAMTKQAALIWTAGALPLLLLYTLWKTSKRYMGLLAVLLWGLLVFWWGLEGHGVTDNTGVIGASTQGRAWLPQWWFAVKKYWIFMPHLFLLYALAAYGSIRHRFGAGLWFLFIIPGTLSWFLFGAYHLRLGVHFIAVLGFIVLYLMPFFSIPMVAMPKGNSYKRAAIFWTSLTLLSLLACGFIYQRSFISKQPDLNIYQASTISFRKYFGSDSDWILKNIYDRPDLTLFVPASYISGFFYGHTAMVRPDYQSFRPYDRAALLADWKKHRPDYVFTSGTLLQGNPASELILSLAQDFPDLLQCVAEAPNRYGYKIYRLNARLVY